MPARADRAPAPTAAPFAASTVASAPARFAPLGLTLFCALALAPPEAARAAGYIALDGSSVTLGEAFDEDTNPRGGRLRLGLRISHAFDIEVHAGTSRDRETVSFDSIEASWAGAYLKGYLPVGDRSALFALGGVAGVSLAQTVGSVDIADERGGFSFGAGLETELTERLDLSADWMRYVGDDGGAFEQVDAASIGLKLYF